MALSLVSKIVLYADIGVMGLLGILLFFWQINVLRGKAMKNPDGSVDDFREQKVLYGMALMDLVLAVPVTLLGVVLIFAGQPVGLFVTAMTAFWFVWINGAFTVTSFRFQKPKMTLMWFIVYPFGAIVGLVYLVWFFVHLEEILRHASL